ncbi:hypothetical protein ACJX0J_036552 [Zea mays]
MQQSLSGSNKLEYFSSSKFYNLTFKSIQPPSTFNWIWHPTSADQSKFNRNLVERFAYCDIATDIILYHFHSRSKFVCIKEHITAIFTESCALAVSYTKYDI